MAELATEYTAEKFLDKIATTDSSGVPIPQWKRVMLAKKAAEKARKEAEQVMLIEHEKKRISAIPEWKRQLMNRKEDAYGYASSSSNSSTISSTSPHRYLMMFGIDSRLSNIESEAFLLDKLKTAAKIIG